MPPDPVTLPCEEHLPPNGRHHKRELSPKQLRPEPDEEIDAKNDGEKPEARPTCLAEQETTEAIENRRKTKLKEEERKVFPRHRIANAPIAVDGSLYKRLHQNGAPELWHNRERVRSAHQTKSRER